MGRCMRFSGLNIHPIRKPVAYRQFPQKEKIGVEKDTKTEQLCAPVYRQNNNTKMILFKLVYSNNFKIVLRQMMNINYLLFKMIFKNINRIVLIKCWIDKIYSTDPILFEEIDKYI